MCAAQDTDKAQNDNSNGVTVLSKATARTNIALLHYDTESNSNTIKKYGELCNAVACLTNDTTTGTGTVTVAGAGNDELTFTEAGEALLLVPGQIITINNEPTTVATITSATTATTATPLTAGAGLTFTYQTAYICQETPTVQAQQVAEGLYKVNISGTIDTLLYYPLL
jgi:hypothetical protein